MKLSDYRHMPPVASLMTPFPHFVEPGESLEQVSKLMDQHEIHHIPLKQSGEVVGLISATAIAVALGAGASSKRMRAADLRSTALCVVDFSDPLNEALDELAGRHADAAVVLKDGHLAGILTVTDICDALRELLEDRFSTGPDGAA